MFFENFFQDRHVLVTGDTGFKGAWLVAWLTKLGARVSGVGLPAQTTPALFDVLELERRIAHTNLDIRDGETMRSYLAALKPDIVIHLAAQSLVRRSYREPVATLATNVMGTAHLLDAVGRAGYTADAPCSVVVVTSDKCYEIPAERRSCREEDRMGGHDVYSCSKGAVELVAAAWRRSFFEADYPRPAIRLATCRAGNVIGGGDWAEDRIVPDCIRALQNGVPIEVRHPSAVRPWQHVLEPLSGYLQVAERLASDDSATRDVCSAWNFGPGVESERPVAEVCDAIVKHWGSGSWQHVGDAGAVHEAPFLQLAIDKAEQRLGWKPIWGLDTAIGNTITWYRRANAARLDSRVSTTLVEEQIDEYETEARRHGLPWARPASRSSV